MDTLEQNDRNGQGKITAAKRIIARMDDKAELDATERYIKERRTLLYRREKELKLAARWEKVKALGPGAELSVWTTTAPRDIIRRGDIFKIESFSPRGRKCARLRFEKDGTLYSFSPENIAVYDLRPATDGDPTEQPITSMLLPI